MKALCSCIAFLTLLVGMAGCSKPSVTSPTSQTTPVSTVSSISVADAIAKVRPAIVRVITENGMGSGMVIDKAGDVLTNNHVIEGSQTVNVEFSSGLKLPAIILGRDEITDLAILKVNGVNLPVVTFGDSSKLAQGEEVIAIGYPLDLAGSTTITKGIVSAFRNYDGVDYIQTDTSINPGNSGGALINLKGEVVGINVMSIRDAGGQTIEGMNFAIAINGTKPIIPKLIAGESILKPWETFESDDFGYSIQYPNTWVLQNIKDLSGDFSDIDIRTGKDASVQILVPRKTTDSFDSIVDNDIKLYSQNSVLFEVLSRKNLTWPGMYEAYEWTYLFRLVEEQPYVAKRKTLMLKRNGYLFEIHASAAQSEYESHSATIEDILNSFRFTQ